MDEVPVPKQSITIYIPKCSPRRPCNLCYWGEPFPEHPQDLCCTCDSEKVEREPQTGYPVIAEGCCVAFHPRPEETVVEMNRRRFKDMKKEREKALRHGRAMIVKP